jgi:hypothetical protein
MRNGRPTTKDEVLQQIEARDTIVTHLRRYRRYARMLADPLCEGVLIGSDGTIGPTVPPRTRKTSISFLLQPLRPLCLPTWSGCWIS